MSDYYYLFFLLFFFFILLFYFTTLTWDVEKNKSKIQPAPCNDCIPLCCETIKLLKRKQAILVVKRTPLVNLIFQFIENAFKSFVLLIVVFFSPFSFWFSFGAGRKLQITGNTIVMLYIKTAGIPFAHLSSIFVIKLLRILRFSTFYIDRPKFVFF